MTKKRIKVDIATVTIISCFSALMVGIYGIIPKGISGYTIEEVAQTARETTREEVKWSVYTLDNVDTSQDQLDARWQILQSEMQERKVEGTQEILASARATLPKRIWPVTYKWGRIKGEPVWALVASWNAEHATSCFCNIGCEERLREQNAWIDNRATHVLVFSAEAPYKLIHHDYVHD